MNRNLARSIHDVERTKMPVAWQELRALAPDESQPLPSAPRTTAPSLELTLANDDRLDLDRLYVEILRALPQACTARDGLLATLEVIRASLFVTSAVGQNVVHWRQCQADGPAFELAQQAIIRELDRLETLLDAVYFPLVLPKSAKGPR